MNYQGLQNTHLCAGILRALALLTIFLGALGISSQMVIAQTATSAITGRWDTMPYKMPINPIHVGLMHTGQVLIVAGSENDPRRSGLALDNSGSTSNGNYERQYTPQSGNSNQMWQLVSVGNGLYQLICKTGGVALDNRGSTSIGTAVGQWTPVATTTNQKWSCWISFLMIF
jgi:hypothetical protein